ncbi:hypothetical protein GAYE_SCF13G3409 [Galdieria yellowstonensis]|uniref:Uncharacterized protein n=1 Tax=Galdieria yellowstonensis TaxID=3028027 RepID=A0AAV9IE84_9RHOD|nr:hypothetical protein GAYE_SCF13G3409 [Galdieria yellowstonensis]
MSTENNKLDEFFSKKDLKKKKVVTTNKPSKTDEKPKKHTASKKQAEEGDEVNLDVTPSSSSLAGLEKLSFLSISSSSVGSWADEEEKQEGQPILHSKGRSLSNLRKDTTFHEEEGKESAKEDKFTGWKTVEAKPSDTNGTQDADQSTALTNKPAEEKFPTLEETARLPKSSRASKAMNAPATPTSTENKTFSRPGSKVAGSLRALLLESQQDKVPKRETTALPSNRQQEKNVSLDTSSTIDSNSGKSDSPTLSTESKKEASQGRRRFSGLQAILEEASRDKQVPKATNGLSNSQVSKEKSTTGSWSKGNSVEQQKKVIDSKNKQRVANVPSSSVDRSDSGSTIDSGRNNNRYAALSDDMLQDDGEY